MKLYLLASIVAVLLMATYLQAENIVKEPVCKSISECDKLTERLQAQIDGLKLKGFKNLSTSERKQFIILKKQLLAAQKAKTTEVKRETAEIRKTNKKLDELSNMLK